MLLENCCNLLHCHHTFYGRIIHCEVCKTNRMRAQKFVSFAYFTSLDSTWWKWLGKQVGGAHIISETDFKSHLRWHWHFSLILHTDSDASFIVPFQYHFIPSLFLAVVSLQICCFFYYTWRWEINLKFKCAFWQLGKCLWWSLCISTSFCLLRHVLLLFVWMCVCVCVFISVFV